MKWLYRFPLRWVLPGGILLFAFTLIFIAGISYLPQMDKAVEEEAHSRIRNMMNLLQISVEFLANTEEWDEIAAEITALGADPAIELAAFIDDRDRVLSATRFEWLSQPLPAVWRAFSGAAADESRESLRGVIQLTADRQQLQGYFPVRVNTDQTLLRRHKVGLIVISVDLSAEKAAARLGVERQIVKSGLVILGLSILAGLFLHLVITRRMELVGQKAMQFAQGNYQTRLNLQGHDEVARLGNAFDRVADIIERDSRQLKDNEQRYRSLVETIPYGIQESDLDGVITYTNHAYDAMFGYPPHAALGTHIWDKLPSEPERAGLRNYYHYLIAETPDPQVYTSKNVTVDGRLIDIEVAWTYKIDAWGEVRGFTSVITDTSERIKLEEERQLAASVFDNSLQGIMVTAPNGRILNVNPAFTEITGYSAEEAIGQTPRIMRSEQHDEAFYKLIWDTINSAGSWQGEIWNRHKSGEVFPVWQSIKAMHNAEGEVERYVAIFNDITEQKVSQERINHLAHYDVLTELPNRLLFNDRLSHAMERDRRGESHLAILFIDLDNFKNVNDTLGHPVGDQLLKTVADRLHKTLREGDTIARLGGDEFIVLLEDVVNERDAEAVAKKCLNALSTTIALGRHEAFVSCSIGIAIFPQDGDELHTLIKNADTAMYRAKGRGKNAYQFYTADMSAAAAERLSLESALRQAIDNDEFVLYYQPKLDLASGRIASAEVLIRWMHPEMGMVPPDRFIGLAEETGLIGAIGQWVVKTACRQMYDWQQAGIRLDHVAVNLSGYQVVHDDIVTIVGEALTSSGLEAEYLELEITESFVMTHLDEALQTLFRLKDLGVSLAIDDFGTGYSSLAYLKRLPVHRLKIDRSFVKDIPEDRDDEAISAAIIALAHSLGLQVTAEGVETQAQMDFLRAHACDEAQGYFFARPMPAAELESFLRS